MGFTFVAKAAHGGGFGPLSSLAVTLTGVHVGDLVVVCLKHEESATTYSCADSGGSGSASTFVQDPDGRAGGASGDNTIVFYTLASQRSGSVTYTITLGGTKPWPGICAMAYTPSGTASFEDSANQNGTSDGSGNFSSPNITVGDDNVVFGFYGEIGGTAASSTKVNGVASDQAVTDTDTGQGDTMWSKVNATGFTGNVSAIMSGDPGDVYTVTAMGFKNVDAAGDTLMGMKVF